MNYEGQFLSVPLSSLSYNTPLTEKQKEDKKKGDADEITVQELVCNISNRCGYYIDNITPENIDDNREAMIIHINQTHLEIQGAGDNLLPDSCNVEVLICPKCEITGIELYKKKHTHRRRNVTCFTFCRARRASTS